MCLNFLKSSIGKKQIVAVTGLLLILFLIGHLAGNLLIFGGPSVFNGYADTLLKVRPLVILMEIGLLLIFLVHIGVTIWLVLENIKSAGVTRYAVAKSRGERSLATQLRVYTGLFLIAFVVWHIFDFTLSDHKGPRSMMGNEHMGLYGVVYGSFLNPLHSLLYIIAMGCLGFHLAHGVQSLMQTFGFNHPRYTPMILKFSTIFAWVLAVGYSSIPVYVMVRGHCCPN